jgi:uncharacterized protein YbjQ (UPF0145 family)
MGIFDLSCEQCKHPFGQDDEQYVLSKNTKKVYKNIDEFSKAEGKIFGVKVICQNCYTTFDGYNKDGYIQLIPVTTTGNFEDKKIIEYRGVVGAQVIFGANVIKDFVAGITDFTGGRSGTLEKVLKDGRTEVLKQLTSEAISEKANAIIGLKIDLETTERMYMLYATGTAVVIEKDSESTQQAQATSTKNTINKNQYPYSFRHKGILIQHDNSEYAVGGETFKSSSEAKAHAETMV